MTMENENQRTEAADLAFLVDARHDDVHLAILHSAVGNQTTADLFRATHLIQWKMWSTVIAENDKERPLNQSTTNYWHGSFQHLRW